MVGINSLLVKGPYCGMGVLGGDGFGCYYLLVI